MFLRSSLFSWDTYEVVMDAVLWRLGFASIKPREVGDQETRVSRSMDETRLAWVDTCRRYMGIHYPLLLYFSVCLNISKTKHFLKCPVQKVQASYPPHLHQSPQFPPTAFWAAFSLLPQHLLGYFSLQASRAPHCLGLHSWRLDKYLFLTPDGITASPVWSCQHIFSRHLIPGCGNNKAHWGVWLVPPGAGISHSNSVSHLSTLLPRAPK